MSSEDDTFNALKKWTFDEINDVWNKPFMEFTASGGSTWNAILEKAGWTNDEFWDERKKMYDRHNI